MISNYPLWASSWVPCDWKKLRQWVNKWMIWGLSLVGKAFLKIISVNLWDDYIIAPLPLPFPPPKFPIHSFLMPFKFMSFFFTNCCYTSHIHSMRICVFITHTLPFHSFLFAKNVTCLFPLLTRLNPIKENLRTFSGKCSLASPHSFAICHRHLYLNKVSLLWLLLESAHISNYSVWWAVPDLLEVMGLCIVALCLSMYIAQCMAYRKHSVINSGRTLANIYQYI